MASCGRSALNSCTESSKRACCCRLFMPGGRVASRLGLRCILLWRLFGWGSPGLLRSIAMTRPCTQFFSSHRTRTVIQADKHRSLDHALRSDRLRVERHRAFVAEEPARRKAQEQSAYSQRHLLGFARRRTMARSSRTIWVLYHGLQPVQFVAQG